MIADKDREEAKTYLEKLFAGKPGTGSWHGLNDRWSESELVEMQAERDSRLRTESAGQARKDAAEKIEAMKSGSSSSVYDTVLTEAITTILGDYAPVSTVAEKLAIAVKAMEYVASKSIPSPAFESHYSRLQDACAKASDALKEIQ